MRINLSFFLYIAIAILLLMQLKDCNKTTNIDEVIKSDTVKVFIPGKPDTIFIENTKVIYKDRKPDTVIVEVTPEGDTLQNYTTTFNDTLLEATITSKVKGELISTGFTYKPLFPKYITRVDTFKIDVNTVTERNRFEFYLGAMAGASADKFSFIPNASLRTKKNLLFTVGYDLLNKTYHLGGSCKIF